MVEDGGDKYSPKNGPWFFKTSGQHKGQELSFITHFGCGNKKK